MKKQLFLLLLFTYSFISNAQSNMVDIRALDSTILIDIKYATEDNFVKKVIYPCGKCLLRPEAAKALVVIQQLLKEEGMGLLMYDCYRPRPAQQELWNIMPNASYVTPPSKGSMHNRGLAVDLTIIDYQTKEVLDMGTGYDFFGKEAHYDYLNHPKQVLKNRQLLREILAAAGFKGIRTEWWHFNYPVSKVENGNFESEYWNCK